MNLGLLTLLGSVPGLMMKNADAESGSQPQADDGADQAFGNLLRRSEATPQANDRAVQVASANSQVKLSAQAQVAAQDTAATQTAPLLLEEAMIVPEVPADIAVEVQPQAVGEVVALPQPLPLIIATGEEEEDVSQDALLPEEALQPEGQIVQDLAQMVQAPQEEPDTDIVEHAAEEQVQATIVDPLSTSVEHADEVVVAVAVPQPVVVDTIAATLDILPVAADASVAAPVADAQPKEQAVLPAEQTQPGDEIALAALPVRPAPAQHDKNTHEDKLVGLAQAMGNVAAKAPEVAQAPEVLARVQHAMNERISGDAQMIREALSNPDDAQADAILKAWQLDDDVVDIDVDTATMNDEELQAVVARLLSGRAEGKSAAGDAFAMNAAVNDASARMQPMVNPALIQASGEQQSISGGVDDVMAQSVDGTAHVSQSSHAELLQRPAMMAARADHGAAQSHAHTPSEQVQMSIQRALAEGKDNITIRLQPEELGRVEVRMEITAVGRSNIVFSVEKPETLELLQRDARQLEQMLRDAGLNAGAGDMQFNLQQQAQGDDADAESYGAYATPQSASVETETYVDAVTGHYTIVVNQGVDIRV